MSASSLSPEEVRAAAGAHQELGPEYSDAVVTSFLDKIDKDIAARVDARLAGTPQAEPAKPENSTLLKGIAIGTAMGTFPLLLAMSLARGDQAMEGPLQWLLGPMDCRGGGLRRWRSPGPAAVREPPQGD